MPYAIGLQAAANAFVSAGFATQFTIAVIAFLSIVLIASAFQNDAPDAPVSLPGLSLSHIVPFYRRRFDFLNWGIQATGQSVFRFKLLRNNVVVVSGESGRQAFFSAKGLDLTEGFRILSGAIPSVSGVTTDLQSRRIATIHKRVAAAQREGHLSTLLPHLLEDSRRVMERWGTSGKFDPFENIYELTFQTTIRALSCGEIADDHALVAHVKKLYDKLDTGTTPTTILMPWLPSWTMISKLWSTKEIYDVIVKAVKQRQELLEKTSGSEKPQDTMQLLLDAGDDTMAIVGFIMGLLIAGARATGTSASWLVTFMASHPEWARKARAEVEDLVASQTNVRFATTATAPSSWTPSSPILVSPTSPATGSGSNPSRPTLPSMQPNTATAGAIVTNFPSMSSPIMSTSPTAIRTPTSPLANGAPLFPSSIPSPTIPTAWSSRRQSYQSYLHYPHTPSHHQRRDSQSSTLSNKRKRCNSGSDGDSDNPSRRVGRRGSRRASIVVRQERQTEVTEKEKVGFPDSDGEKELELEERIISGPVSLLGDGRRRRKDAIMVSSAKGPSRSKDSSMPAPSPATPFLAPPSLPPRSSQFFPNPPPPTYTQQRSISQTLAQIPLEAWETSTPIMDVLIKETLRVAQPHTAMRRNVGPEIYIDGKHIETGDYVVYPFSDVHLDEDIYERAGKWLPERWLNFDENSDCYESGHGNGKEGGAQYGYVGWGGGKSMCLGTRLAKVELKLIISMFVLGFDLGIVDKTGKPKPVEEMPRPNWNDILLCRPKKGEFYLGFERREGTTL
ncbi:Lanosterol 14-alpha demethylase [Leucoagaricus sp. SymC.cos]|nr:Lanosterol 14-alpha demethylase [Leucoagaricus sp. SymC.cos]